MLKRANDWNIEGCVLICFELINYLYNEYVDKKIISILESNVKQTTERNMYKHIYE